MTKRTEWPEDHDWGHGRGVVKCAYCGRLYRVEISKAVNAVCRCTVDSLGFPWHLFNRYGQPWLGYAKKYGGDGS